MASSSSITANASTPLFASKTPIRLKQVNPLEAVMHSKTKYSAMSYMRPGDENYDHRRPSHPHSGSTEEVIIATVQGSPHDQWSDENARMKKCDYIFLLGVLLVAYLAAQMLSRFEKK